MSERFSAFSDDFQKRISSTRRSATTKKLAAFYMILTRSRFYGIMVSSYTRMKFIMWIKLVTVISMHTLKIKVCSYYLKKENLSRRIKPQKLRSQNTIVLERLTLKIIKNKSNQKKNYRQSNNKSSSNKNLSVFGALQGQIFYYC